MLHEDSWIYLILDWHWDADSAMFADNHMDGVYHRRVVGDWLLFILWMFMCSDWENRGTFFL